MIALIAAGSHLARVSGHRHVTYVAGGGGFPVWAIVVIAAIVILLIALLFARPWGGGGYFARRRYVGVDDGLMGPRGPANGLGPRRTVVEEEEIV
jgi:hypothetical protein